MLKQRWLQHATRKRLPPKLLHWRKSFSDCSVKLKFSGALKSSWNGGSKCKQRVTAGRRRQPKSSDCAHCECSTRKTACDSLGSNLLVMHSQHTLWLVCIISLTYFPPESLVSSCAFSVASVDYAAEKSDSSDSQNKFEADVKELLRARCCGL